MMNYLRRLTTVFLLLVLGYTMTSCELQSKDSVSVYYPTSESPSFLQPLEGYTLLTSEETIVQTEVQEGDQPINYEDMKGVWISYLEYGWALKGKSEQEFYDAIQTMFDKVQSLGLNTVIVQVRSHGDAYYPSQWYPWSQYVSGSVGINPGFDPLQIMVEQAHQRGLSVHAWLNPYRLMQDEGMSLTPDQYLIKQWYQSAEYASYMTKVGDYWYLNPGNEQVQNLIIQGASELVNQYQIDGLQIDDYFYTASPQVFGQDHVQAKANTTAMVKGLYDAIKTVNTQVLFGVSPAGNYTDSPHSDNTQYTDLQLWCTTEGYLDYVAPQIYWDFDDAVAPFAEIVTKWENLVSDSSCKLYVGLADYKFAGTENFQKQMDFVDDCKVAKGYIHFRYDNLFG